MPPAGWKLRLAAVRRVPSAEQEKIAARAARLETLSHRQSDAGQRAEALAAATQAGELYRQLAEANPAAFVPNLASLLTNLATAQGRRLATDGIPGHRHSGLQPRRTMAEAEPAVFLPDLAMALNSLANQQSNAGQRVEVLATATQAGELYRQLAEADPAAFLPDLADALGSAPDDPTAVRHLAILRLTATLPIDDVYDAVDDPSIARDEAMAAVAAGDATTIQNLWLAAPALGRLPFTGPFLAAAHRILTGDEGDVHELVEAAAAAGTPVQRAAAAARFRHLARTRPEHADTVNRLLPILEAEPETEPTKSADATEQPP